MNLLGHTLEYVGVILIAYTALRVHTRVREEHKIDKAVFGEMKKEGTIGIVGIIFITIGFFLQIPGYL